MFIDRKGYTHYDPKHKVIEEVKGGKTVASASSNLVGGGDMTTQHFQNFIDAIRTDNRKSLHSPIEEASVSVTSLHLANIAWKMGRSLKTNPKTGRIQKDKAAMAMWGREYEKGWELKV